MKRTAGTALLAMLLGLFTAGCATSRAERMEDREIGDTTARQGDVQMPQPLESSEVAVDREVDMQAQHMATEPVDLNSATFEELKRVPGIDENLARQIFFYRSKAGRFYNVDQLLQVKGMDAERLELIRPWVSVGGAQRETPARPPTDRPDLAPPAGVPGAEPDQKMTPPAP